MQLTFSWLDISCVKKTESPSQEIQEDITHLSAMQQEEMPRSADPVELAVLIQLVVGLAARTQYKRIGTNLFATYCYSVGYNSACSQPAVFGGVWELIVL